jgi:4-aminobutyrate aminotransferase-like enzyme
VLAAGASAIRLSPPLVVTRDQAQTAVAILDEALAELAEISNS